jgi:transposase
MLWRRGKAYSQDLRERVLASEDAGVPVGQIAKRFAVSVSYVSKVLSRRRMSGERTARPQCCHVPRKLASLHGAIREHVASHPDATLAELRAWLLQAHQVTASEGLMCATLARLGLTRKKRPFTQPSRTAPTLPGPARSGGATRPG